MNIFKKSLLEQRSKLIALINKIDDDLNNNEYIKNELEEIDFRGKKVFFTNTPAFLYNEELDIINYSPNIIGNFSIEDNVRNITVGDLQINKDFTLQDWVDSLEEEQSKVAFYPSESGSLYHEGRRVRVAAF